MKKRKSRGKILFSSFCSIKVAVCVYNIWENETYQIAVWCLFEYFIHTSRKAIYHCIHNSLQPWLSTTKHLFISFIFLFILLINHCQENFLYVFSITTQIVLNSKHDVYYIARFRKRARSLPFDTMKWQQRRRRWHHIVVNLFILMSKWYGWQTVYIVTALKT